VSETVRGVVIILVVGVVILLIAALADRRSRLRLQRERPAGAPEDGIPAPDYITDEQLAASARLLRTDEVPDERALAAIEQAAAPLNLRLASDGFATLARGRALLTHPRVLVCRDGVETTRELLGVLRRAAAASVPLVVAAPTLSAEVADTLVANARAGTLAVVALTGSDDALSQLAIQVGAVRVARTDLQADDVPDEYLGQAVRLLADARHAWIDA